MDNFTHLCLNCEQADMQLQAKDITLSFDGLSLSLAQVRGWHCPVCGEIEFADKDSAERYDVALETLHAQAQSRDASALALARKRLKLTQKQAAELTGGGHNAFSRYERGEVAPMRAVVNLFKLLDKHPELLRELRREL